MQGRKVCVFMCVGIVWLFCLSAEADQSYYPDQGGTAYVECDKGKSINALLAKQPPMSYLTIWVLGTCRESVYVNRTNLTLRGDFPGHPGVIDPPDDEDGIPIGPAILALGAHKLTLQDLTLTGGTSGLEAHGSRGMQLTRVNAVENVEDQVSPDSPWGCAVGIRLNGSEAEIADSNLSSNCSPLYVHDHSTAFVWDTMMENNFGDGPWSHANSHLEMVRCTVRGNPLGPQACHRSTTRVFDSIVESPGYTGMSGAWVTGDLEIVRTEIHGRIVGVHRSMVFLSEAQVGSGTADDSVQVANDSSIEIENGTINGSMVASSFSNIRIRFDASINGSIALYNFSDIRATTVEPIQGSVDCAPSGNRALCNPDPQGGINGCE